jgi:FimV-like protein
LALAYIKDKNIDKARSLLKQLTEEGDEKTKNRARKLIEYINNN